MFTILNEHEAPVAVQIEPDSWLEGFHRDAQAGLLSAPPYASWVLTRACNLHCEYCFAEAGKKDPDELSEDEVKRVIDDFALSGVASFTFLGGEPLTRPDIFRLIDHATDRGIYVGLQSNGTLITETVLEQLSAAGCEAIGVSLDSNDPAVHDSVRGKAGSLVRTLDALRAAIRRGIRTSIRIVVTPKSYPAIPALFYWALEEGIEELIVLPLFHVGRASMVIDRPDRDLASKRLFIRALDELRVIASSRGVYVPPDPIACPQGIELNPRDSSHFHLGHAVGFERSAGCKVGRYSISVQPNGDVYPCSFAPVSLGNLRHQSIRELWQAPLLVHERRNRVGCVARSLIHTGLASAPDPTNAG